MSEKRFLLDLIFYQKLNESNQIILRSIDSSAHNIINDEDSEDILYVLGKIKFEDTIRPEERCLSIAGIYKKDSDQLYLAHSLSLFLPNKIINAISFSERSIIKDIKLISFLSKIELTFQNSSFNLPDPKEEESKKKNFLEVFQEFVVNKYPDKINQKTFPLIFLELSPTDKKVPKTHYNCQIHGFFMERFELHNITFVYNEMNGYQYNNSEIQKEIEESDYIFGILIILRIIFILINIKRNIKMDFYYNIFFYYYFCLFLDIGKYLFYSEDNEIRTILYGLFIFFLIFEACCFIYSARFNFKEDSGYFLFYFFWSAVVFIFLISYLLRKTSNFVFQIIKMLVFFLV